MALRKTGTGAADQVAELTLRRIGNSLGVILPIDALRALGVEQEGEKLVLARSEDGQGLRLSHIDPEFARKLAALRRTLDRYKNALAELAK